MGIIGDQGNGSQPATEIGFAERTRTVEFGEIKQHVRGRLADEYVLRLRCGRQLDYGVNGLRDSPARVKSFKDYDIKGTLPKAHPGKIARGDRLRVRELPDLPRPSRSELRASLRSPAGTPRRRRRHLSSCPAGATCRGRDRAGANGPCLPVGGR